jgi:hypothetical protein
MERAETLQIELLNSETGHRLLAEILLIFEPDAAGKGGRSSGSWST